MRPPPALFHLGVLGLATATATTRPAGNNNDDGGGDVKISDWAWDAITPTRHLEYHDCYGAFKCARLQLPLDWKNTSDPRTVAIAVVKLPARVPDDDATFGGSVFTNPGGPGGSGVGLVLSSGRLLQDYVDRPGRRHYEIVSFDPRGMALSRPLANCFPGTMLARDALAVESRGLGAAFRDGAAMAYVLALKQGYGQRCELAEDTAINGGDIFRYMGTPSVARDMVEMVDRIDELRRRDGQSPSEAATEDGGDDDNADDDDDEGEEEQGQRMELKKRAEADEIPRLQYIGFSYGTVLGNYFASLFPERIGRIVLDGVCNTDDYSKGAGWLTNTVDADAIIDQLFEGCFAAGPTRCALARPGDKSASSIGDRLWGWIRALDAAPVSGLSYAGSSIVMTGADIRRIMGSAAYSPLVAFRPLAQLLDDAMRGTNLAALLSAIETGSYGGPLQNACPVPPPDGSSPPGSGRLEQGSDGTTSVVCGDGADVTGKNLTWWQSYQAQQLARSSVLGDFWTTIRLPCARWRLKANWVFRGPYTTPEPSRRGEAPQKGRPAAPLLFLTNRLDPVTPLRAARAMAAQHPGAKVVVQETMGHCAFGSAYSPCTKDAVAEYFDTGRLPDEEEASCPVECGPWNASTACSGAVVAAREPWHVRRFPLGI